MIHTQNTNNITTTDPLLKYEKDMSDVTRNGLKLQFVKK